MDISLILVTEGQDIRTFLENIYSQTYKGFELIVIDTDGANYNLCYEYSKKIKMRYEKVKSDNLGILRNRGLLYVGGDIISFATPETRYTSNMFLDVKAYLYDKPKNIYVCNVEDMDLLDENQELGVYGLNKVITEGNYFINIKGDDILFFQSDFEGDILDLDYVTELVHKGYEGKYFANHKITKDSVYDEEKEHTDYDDYTFGMFCKKEITERKNLAYVAIMFKYMLKKGNSVKQTLKGFFS